jgi:hypothetical protein
VGGRGSRGSSQRSREGQALGGRGRRRGGVGGGGWRRGQVGGGARRRVFVGSNMGARGDARHGLSPCTVFALGREAGTASGRGAAGAWWQAGAVQAVESVCIDVAAPTLSSQQLMWGGCQREAGDGSGYGYGYGYGSRQKRVESAHVRVDSWGGRRARRLCRQCQLRQTGCKQVQPQRWGKNRE